MGVRRAALVLIVAAALLGPAESAFAGPVVTDADKLRAGVISEMNRVRSAHGLRTLTVRPRLQNAGSGHANNLAKHGVFTHDWSNGTPFAKWIGWYWPGPGYTSWSAGENLAWGAPGLGVRKTVSLWMHSPGHRANLLSKTWNRVGVSVVHVTDPVGTFAPYSGATIVTADFGRRSR